MTDSPHWDSWDADVAAFNAQIIDQANAESKGDAEKGIGKGKGKDDKGKGKGKGDGHRKGRDPSRERTPGGGGGKANARENSRQPNRERKTKLFCKSFLDTGVCAIREKGGYCGLAHLNAEGVAALKTAFGDDLQGYYNPPAPKQ